MKKTGWKVVRCVANKSREGFPLDKDGARVDRIDSEGVPISASGKKRSAYIWNKVDKNSTPAGGKFSYAKEFEIMGEYSLPTPLPDPEGADDIWVSLGGKQVNIATYKGKDGQDCPNELFEFKFANKTQDTLSPLMGIESEYEEQYKYAIDVISAYNGKGQDYTVEIVPIDQARGLIYEKTEGTTTKKSTFRFDRGYEGREGHAGNEKFEIVFTQKGSGRKLTFNLFRRPRYKIKNLNMKVRGRSIAMGNPRNVQVIIYKPISSEHELNPSEFTINKFPLQYPKSNTIYEQKYAEGDSTQISLVNDYYEGDIVPIVGMGYPESGDLAEQVAHTSILQMSDANTHLMKNQALVELTRNNSTIEKLFKPDIGKGYRQLSYPYETSSGNWYPSSMMLVRLIPDANKNINVEFYAEDEITM